MPRKTLTRLLLILLVVGISPWTHGQSSEEKATNEKDLWSQFKIVVERNIFSRQRGRRRRQERSEVERPRYVPTPESMVVLKGVVEENGLFEAFFEDTRAGSMLRIRKGQDVARGQVEALTLDHVVFRHGDKTRIVTLGQNLEGTFGSGNIGLNEMMEWSQTAATATPSTEPGTTESGTPTPEASSEDENEILKKLLERRRQQLGD